MSYESGFLNFCLSCDRHTTDGPYCSQACRLTDLEKSGSSSNFSTSPASMFEFQSTSQSWSSNPSSRSFLPPAVDFSSVSRNKELTGSPDQPREAISRSSSISSTGSHQTSTSTSSQYACTLSQVSESARRELRHYESLFDQSRHRPSR